MLPAFHCFRIKLIGTLQRLLWCQVKFGKQATHRGDTQTDAEFSENQIAHNRARPQPKIKTTLQRILFIDPAKERKQQYKNGPL